MKVFPAIDLRGGKVVQLVGGDPNKVAVEEQRTPLEQAKHWREQGARRLHVVDLDGAFEQGHHRIELGRILADGLPIQFGGGVRSMLDIQQLLDQGVQHVIVGTQAVTTPEWARELALLWPGRIIVAVDARGRDVVVKGWTEDAGHDVIELARSLDDADLAAFLYTNVAQEGRMEGIDESVVRDLRDATPNTPIIISGGIKDVHDLETLEALGVDGVVLGMSVYTGAIDVRAAVERFDPVKVTP